ncbi:septum formation protein Maf [Olsenella sp. AF16-14LB]|jgi:septum formation protein|uniref:Maf family protein n=1 Tax=Atopobiaceae TaxID=1643824 RepID=UPI000509B3A3|nr:MULTISPECIES: Maf family protein [unclassified Olsenella]RGS53156.1 septum formation protein Maf [Olsenella sp. AF21-51]RGU51766.1 septum formation protein Maf [Olsenella sp. AF16-14LB]RGU82995.1 septum formation protein Maf [Olsenella sp. AF15-43LB]RHB56996.1 septum formation protein Maf [Olsenella sp. AM39-30AC]RHJ96234.1 septum formation protein Maf [Olsenella sp. AM05-7]
MYLASQSPRRRQLLEAAGFSLTIVPADIDETRQEGETPTHLVERLARQKAEATRGSLAGRATEDVLLAADTIVWTEDGDVLGKPVDVKAACAMLQELSGRTHHVSTGVCLMHLDPTAKALATRSFVETTRVSFFDLTDEEIRAYVASGEPMDKAGAYGIQGRGRLLVSGIEGDWANVVGLPVARVVRELEALFGRRDLVAHCLGAQG